MTSMTPPPVKSIKLLLVDDLDENLRALEALLRRDGLELLKAHSGREALELLLGHDVALALLDVQMPEMDGFALAELMRGAQRTRTVPIIFLTAGGHDAKHMFRGYEAGAVDFLFKPIDPVLLGHKVRNFVDLYRQRRERERLTDELREMLRLNEMLLAAVSHDLRQPLSTIVMGAALLEEEFIEPGPKRTLKRVRSSAERMVAMLEQLYDLASARLGGGIAIDPRETNLRAIADKLVDELRLAHPGQSVVVEYHGSTVGTWDEHRVGQVLGNLVGNALRYGHQGRAGARDGARSAAERRARGPQRRRNSGRPLAAPVRSVPARRRAARAGQPGPRALHRAADRDRPRRHDRGDLVAGGRNDVPHRSCPGRSNAPPHARRTIFAGRLDLGDKSSRPTATSEASLPLPPSRWEGTLRRFKLTHSLRGGPRSPRHGHVASPKSSVCLPSPREGAGGRA